MSEVEWIKLNLNMFEDEKIKLIEQMPERDALLVCWFKLFLLASKKRTFKINNFAKDSHSIEELLSILLNRNIDFIQKMIAILTEVGVMKIEEDTITIKRFWLTNQEIRSSVEYRNWRTEVFKRDNYICQSCGKRGGDLQAHHIKRFSDYEELRLEISNGLTLCLECHKEIHKKGDNNGEI